MFSCFCRDMSWKKFGCRSTLAEMLKANYTPTLTIYDMGGDTAVANWSGLMIEGGYIPPGFSGTSKSRAFLFERQAGL